MFRKTALIAAAFATTLAFMPASADAGSKTRHFIGGVAAGVGGLLLLDAMSRPHYGPRYYAPRYRHYRAAPRYRYYRAAPRYRYYQPVNNCRSTNAALRKLNRRGFHSFHNIRYKAFTTKIKAWRAGIHYQIKVNRCSGNIIWSQAI